MLREAEPGYALTALALNIKTREVSEGSWVSGYGGTKILTALCLSLSMRVVVPLNTIQELLSALGMPDVLNSDVHPLLNVAVTNDLVNNDTDGIWCDIVDDTSSSKTQ